MEDGNALFALLGLGYFHGRQIPFVPYPPLERIVDEVYFLTPATREQLAEGNQLLDEVFAVIPRGYVNNNILSAFMEYAMQRGRVTVAMPLHPENGGYPQRGYSNHLLLRLNVSGLGPEKLAGLLLYAAQQGTLLLPIAGVVALSQYLTDVANS